MQTIEKISMAEQIDSFTSSKATNILASRDQKMGFVTTISPYLFITMSKNTHMSTKSISIFDPLIVNKMSQ
jgi:hypothetical protein